MTLVRLNPWKAFERAATKLNDIASQAEKGFTLETGGFSPRVDIIEDEKFYFLNLELPGINKEDVKISVNEENLLVIKGEKRVQQKDGLSYLRTERVFGQFSRAFALPDNLNSDAIAAKFENGILEITLPKVEPPAPKEIEINIA